jgi:chemotaxis protein MotB
MSLVKDDPYAAVNRRISLVVLNQSTQKRIESENAAAADLSAKDAREVGTAVQAVQAASKAATATKQGEVVNTPPAEGVRQQ